MQNEIDSLLTSDKPGQRKKAIQLMREHPNDSTLMYLAQLAKKDPDKSVRKMAMQLGREIQLAQNPQREKNIDAKREAESILEQALNVMVEGDVIYARRIARKAFQTFPGLKYEAHCREIAADIMQMKPHTAIEQLLGEDKLYREVSGKYAYGKQSGIGYAIRRYLYKEQASWLDIILDIFIYIIAITLPLLIILLAGNAMFTAGLLLTQSAPSTPETQAVILEAANFAGFDGVTLSIFVTIGFILLVTVPFLTSFTFQMIMTHVSAIWFLSGDGSFRNLFHRSLVPMISMTTFYWAVFVATPFLYALGFSSLLEAGLMEILSTFAFFGFLFWFINVIGNVYHMDFGSGCMALMFPYLAVAGCFCSLITINLARAFFVS